MQFARQQSDSQPGIIELDKGSNARITTQEQLEGDISLTEKADPDVSHDPVPGLEVPDDEAQAGLRRVEAVTVTWSKKSLVLAYVL